MFFGVIGYSGAGKSTLVRLINQLEQQTSGDVYVDGHHLNTYAPAQLRAVKRYRDDFPTIQSIGF